MRYLLAAWHEVKELLPNFETFPYLPGEQTSLLRVVIKHSANGGRGRHRLGPIETIQRTGAGYDIDPLAYLRDSEVMGRKLFRGLHVVTLISDKAGNLIPGLALVVILKVRHVLKYQKKRFVIVDDAKDVFV
jgi:hypothetical protein